MKTDTEENYLVKLQVAEIQSLPANRAGDYLNLFSEFEDLLTRSDPGNHRTTRETCRTLSFLLLNTCISTLHLIVFKRMGSVLFPVADIDALVEDLKKTIEACASKE